MSAAHAVGDVLVETDALDGMAGEETSTDEATTKVDEDLNGPGALRVSGIPQRSEQALWQMLASWSLKKSDSVEKNLPPGLRISAVRPTRAKDD